MQCEIGIIITWFTDLTNLLISVARCIIEYESETRGWL